MSTLITTNRSISAVGIGLRSQHFSYIIKQKPPIPWFEVLIDNYLNEQGPPLDYLKKICEHYPVVFHSVGLSLGSSDALNKDYLKKLKTFVKDFAPIYVSDHLSWISLNNHYIHQLLPLPYTAETVQHVVTKIKQVQDYLEQPILIENVSSYLNYKISTMTEWEFLKNVSEEANCYILLDINNIYVSAKNQHYNPQDYLRYLNPNRIKQFHLAGYEEHENYLLDTHNSEIAEPVWDLYKVALEYFGPVPTLIEWDSKIPKFAVLQQQIKKAQQYMDNRGAPVARPRIGEKINANLSKHRCATDAPLHKLQQEFISALRNFDQKKDLPFLELIESSASLCTQQRLAIYQDSMVEGFITALQEIFPVCQKIVGEEFFHALAKKYVQQTPSTSSDLGDYGATFADFIATFAPAQSLPYLADTALLEWLWHRTLHGEDNIPFNFAALANIPENLQNEIIFQLPKNNFLITAKFPISRIWEIHQTNYTGDFTVDFSVTEERLIIFKSEQIVKIVVLTAAEWSMLQTIKSAKKVAEFSESELILLPAIIAKGLFSGFILNDNNY